MLSKLISSKISKISKMTKFMSTRKAKIIDVHTHMYYPNYVNILKNRKNIPNIINVEGQDVEVRDIGPQKEEVNTGAMEIIAVIQSEIDDVFNEVVRQ